MANTEVKHIGLLQTKQRLVCIQYVPFCRHSPQGGKRQSADFSACQRSFVCHNPVKREDKKYKKGFLWFMSVLLLSTYLKKRDFADDRVVDIYSNVQTHFIWQLC